MPCSPRPHTTSCCRANASGSTGCGPKCSRNAFLRAGRQISSAAAEIASHHHDAGNRRAALGWDLRAATAAEQVGGFAEAADCYRRMLAAWDDVPDAEQEAATDRVEILTRLAQAEELAGDADSVRIHIQEAIKLVDPASDPLRAAMLLDRLSWSLFITGQLSASLDSGRGRS